MIAYFVGYDPYQILDDPQLFLTLEEAKEELNEYEEFFEDFIVFKVTVEECPS